MLDQEVVQWLGLSAFTAVAQVQSLVRELKSHKPWGVAKNKKQNKQANKKHVQRLSYQDIKPSVLIIGKL